MGHYKNNPPILAVVTKRPVFLEKPVSGEKDGRLEGTKGGTSRED